MVDSRKQPYCFIPLMQSTVNFPIFKSAYLSQAAWSFSPLVHLAEKVLFQLTFPLPGTDITYLQQYTAHVVLNQQSAHSSYSVMEWKKERKKCVAAASASF